MRPKYLVDEKHSNCVAKPDYPGGIEKVDEASRRAAGRLDHARASRPCDKRDRPLGADSARRSGAELKLAGVPCPSGRGGETAAVRRRARRWTTAVATPDASVQRDGSTVRVRVSKSNGRPGVDIPAGDGRLGHDRAGLRRGPGQERRPSHAERPPGVWTTPGPTGPNAKAASIQSATIPPGEEQVLKVAIASRPPKLLETAFRGMRAAPGGFGSSQSGSLDPANVVRISVYVYHPGADYEYEVSDLSAGGAPAFPLPRT